MSQATTTVLNNSKRKLVLGDSGKGHALAFHPGATTVPAALFALVHDADDQQGSTLRAYLKGGTLTKIENAAPLKPEDVTELKGDALIAAASKHGDVETRSRLAHRAHVLGADPELRPPMESRHLFEPLSVGVLDASDIDPLDPKRGYKLWLPVYQQRHTDQMLVCIAQDRAAVSAHQANLEAAAAAVRAAQKVGV
ncbi:MAG TPA: hypothetical protein VFN67_29885 [Polyangiales bacterium]|nr:hypothetical protein [Polyangiales bacterium]